MKDKFEALYGLRGFAVMWVFLFHLYMWLPSIMLPPMLFANYGVGVDIFFLLTGFLIMHAHHTMRISTAGWGLFLIKRAFRLYPTHIAIMLLLALETLIRPPTGEWGRFYYDWHVFPYVLTLTATDFGFKPDYWNWPSWFLDVEVACSLVVPPLVMLLSRIPDRFVFAALTISLAIEVLTLTDFQSYEFYPATVGLRCFARGLSGMATGMMLFRAWRKYPGGFRGFDLLAVFLYFTVTFSRYAMFGPVAACAVIASLATGRGFASHMTRTRPLRYLGQISLSLYLIHAPALAVVRHLQPLLVHYMTVMMADSLTVVLTISAGIAGAAILNRLVERPCILLGNRVIGHLAQGKLAA